MPGGHLRKAEAPTEAEAEKLLGENKTEEKKRSFYEFKASLFFVMAYAASPSSSEEGMFVQKYRNRQIKAREEQNKKSREKRLFRCGYSVWHKRFGRA